MYSTTGSGMAIEMVLAMRLDSGWAPDSMITKIIVVNALELRALAAQQR
jgi:hypothetical protein